MKQKISIIVLCLAEIMFLLHGIVPHHHHNSISLELEHGHAVEHIMNLLHSHEENEDHSHGHCLEHSTTEQGVAANNAKQQTGAQWYALTGLPGTSIFITEPLFITHGIESWGNVIARVLSPHIIGHGLRAPPSVIC